AVESGTVVAIIGDYSPDSVALIIALILNKNILVPLSPLAETHFSEYFGISHTEHVIDLSDQGCRVSRREAEPSQHDILKNLIKRRHPGLILFTSGSTGEPKAVVHDFDKLLSKFLAADKSYRTLCFLMFDHIAGIDTYFYCLYSGGTVIFPTSRNPGDICRLIEKHRVEVLPTSPTFLNLLLLSEEYKRYDLSSLKIITFGSESMPSSLLSRLEKVFRGVRIIQKYGVTELGSPPSRSKQSDSSWIKLDSPAFKTKVVNGTLYVKADTAMIGYLNAESPFTEDGWFNTGDAVEVNGEYVRILGRTSEIINVGGEKVFPAEVENVIQEMENVREVTVYGEKNPITGNIVCALVSLLSKEDHREFAARLKKHCRERLSRYKVPVRVTVDDRSQHSERFKKQRL
ncbi:MAG: AMP-binding protein, partial [Candidatus Hydrogenedentota bacterium]